jgi:hypothetical protein
MLSSVATMRLSMKATTRRFCVCWYLYSVVVLLVTLNFSTATYNPAYHPQQHQQGYHHASPTQDGYNHHQPVDWEGAPPRGGSTMTRVEPPQEEPFQPPKIHLKHMSMALRLTSEWNRRLLDGVNRFKFWGKRETTQPQQIPDSPQQPQGYGNHPVNVHPSRSWHPPIQEASPQQMEEELTLFHAKAPRGGSSKQQRRGVARWGPELLPYLEHVVDLLEVTDGVEIPLAMIYLDRACSAETPRSNGVPPCPFCTPRTVHRLTLAALLLARQAVSGSDSIMLEEYFVKLQSLGIPLTQLQQMVDWMRGALGDTGPLVTVGQMKDWSQTWDSIFYPKQRQQRLEQQQQQQQAHLDAPHYHHPPQIQASYPYQ